MTDQRTARQKRDAAGDATPPGTQRGPRAPEPTPRSPWAAMWALVIGFFMILVDTTIVSVANPAIKAALDPDTPNLDNVVWVTSAYLLAYAVPMLITGRLGDRYGPRNLYLIGLAVFTAASLLCGLSDTLGMLIAARAAQGLGAALIAPQTMAIITRIFPANRRGAAMSIWGATSGVALLVGPLAGGFLVDGLGWEWIFFVNIPVGIAGFVLAWLWLPRLQRHEHRFDWFGVALSATGMFLIVFGLQEAEHYDWGVIWGPISVWSLIGVGVAIMGLFVWQQARTRREPLVPLQLFRDRNLSMASVGIASVAFATTAMNLPMMFYLQLARGLTPTEAALLMIPMAVLAGILSPFAGRLMDRIHPSVMLVPALTLLAVSIALYALLMNPDVPIPMLLIPSALLGLASAGTWGPLSTTSARDLPLHQAGAGSSIYNGLRTIGAVIGSASIAALMQGRLVANLPGVSDLPAGEGATGQIPASMIDGFSQAMSQSMLLPAAALVVGVVACAFMRRPAALDARGPRGQGRRARVVAEGARPAT